MHNATDSQALVTKSLQEEIADTAGNDDDEVGESTENSDAEESNDEADKVMTEALELELDEVSTRSQQNKFVIDEDNAEEGNEIQEDESEVTNIETREGDIHQNVGNKGLAEV